jgi:hypothetical protein
VKAQGTLFWGTFHWFISKYISIYRNISLQADMENSEDIREMEREILEGVQHVMNEVVYNCNLPKILLILLLKFL